MRVALFVVAVLLASAPAAVLGTCAEELDVTTNVTWPSTEDGVQASVDCPDEGTATRLCTGGVWENAIYTACSCSADTESGIAWTSTTQGTSDEQDCPGGAGTASRACSGTTLIWDAPSVVDCRCEAGAAGGLNWDIMFPSATPQSKACPSGGQATRVCSLTTLDWSDPDISACRCPAEESDGVEWPETSPSATLLEVACPGGAGNATRECSLTTLEWEDATVSDCMCAEAIDNATGFVWGESAPSDIDYAQDCPSFGGGTVLRKCSTTTLTWEPTDYSGCSCVDETFAGVSWAFTGAGDNDTNDCPDSNGTATRFCSDVSYDWEDPDFSNCTCAEVVTDDGTFPETNAGENSTLDCESGFMGSIVRYCNITSGTWDDAVKDCEKQNSPAASATFHVCVLITAVVASVLANF